MITLDGIHLKASTTPELHEFARRLAISKSWFHYKPKPYYDVICPFKLEAIRSYIKRKNLK